MYQENVLTYNNLKYLKWSLILILLCVGFYLFDSPPIRQGGGTWLGYTLGTIGAVLIVWLMIFGLRKRAYKSNMGTVRGWLSAHVYLGLSLIVVATLHAAFHFGWNIHTVAYILTLTVVFSGVWGVIIYLRNPSLMSNLLNGRTLAQCGEILVEIDAESKKIAESLSPAIQKLINNSASAKIFEYRWQRYFGKHRRCKTNKAVMLLTSHYSQEKVQEIFSDTVVINAADLHAQITAPKLQGELYTLQIRRQIQLKQIRDFLRLKGWTEIWLMFHVPLSFALLAALTAHIISVFFYW